MNNNELLITLLAYANKFINSQYDCNVSIGEASYRNIDLLTVYKINNLYESNRITEEERNCLLDLHHKKIVLEAKLDYSETEKEQISIDKELTEVYEELFKYNLNEDLSIEYLINEISNINKTMDDSLLTSIIYITDILRDEYGLTNSEAAKCINSYGDILSINESKERVEFFMHTSFRTWAQRMYDSYKGKAKKLTKEED